MAIHPGSGSERKNWPVKNWIALSRSDGFPAVVISGEADESQTAQLEIAWKDRAVRFARALPLPQLAAVLENTIFLLVPSLNPDGVDIVTQWYRKTLGTPYE